MPEKQRLQIIKAIRYVDDAVIVYSSIADVLKIYRPAIFAKGGDRTMNNLPKEEIDICKKYNIEIICGLGNKIQSSSWLLDNYKKYILKGETNR
jgi:D-beta-D-heptose 7-phosphate kinase/D-beta-D-heptose 1-phosphate adenosyltransferase